MNNLLFYLLLPMLLRIGDHGMSHILSERGVRGDVQEGEMEFRFESISNFDLGIGLCFMLRREVIAVNLMSAYVQRKFNGQGIERCIIQSLPFVSNC